MLYVFNRYVEYITVNHNGDAINAKSYEETHAFEIQMLIKCKI